MGIITTDIHNPSSTTDRQKPLGIFQEVKKKSMPQAPSAREQEEEAEAEVKVNMTDSVLEYMSGREW
jgi:hypothetical protein